MAAPPPRRDEITTKRALELIDSSSQGTKYEIFRFIMCFSFVTYIFVIVISKYLHSNKIYLKKYENKL